MDTKNFIELRMSTNGIIAVRDGMSLRLISVNMNQGMYISTFELKIDGFTFGINTDLHPLTRDQGEWSISWMWGIQDGGDMLDKANIEKMEFDTSWIFEAMNALMDRHEEIHRSKKFLS